MTAFQVHIIRIKSLIRLLVLTTAAALLMTGCAKKGAPQGGPEDKTGPMIMLTVPGSGAVGVDRIARIQIEFSESIDRTTLLPNLFVSPPIPGTPEAKWKGRKVALDWEDSLRQDVTYRVTIGGKITDQHKNPLGEPLTFAFSTGERIDSARITGHVFTAETPTGGMEVFAYRLNPGTDWDPAAPEFVTQTGEDGAFDLPYLPAGLFRLMAVADRNGNLKPDPNERIAIPEFDIPLDEASTKSQIRMFAHVYDTSAFTIRNCSIGDDGSILVALSAAADTVGGVPAPLEIVDSATGEIQSIEILPPIPPRFSIVPVLSPSLQAGRSCTITVDTTSSAGKERFRDLDGRDFSFGTCQFLYREPVDTTGPRVISTFFPNPQAALTSRAPVVIGFNEPVDTTVEGLMRVRDSLGNAIGGAQGWISRRDIRFQPQQSWPENTIVVVTIDSLKLADRHGNFPPSQTLSWMFAPQTESRIGAVACMVKGPAEMPEDQTPADCHLVARSTTAGLRFQRPVRLNEPFEIDLPAGEWIFSAFLDLDRDNRHSTGTVSPFRFAEPRVVMSDTVSVRARFTVEDIVIEF